MWDDDLSVGGESLANIPATDPATARDESYKTNTIGRSARINNQDMKEPVIIQGGMGAGVSNWRLAQAVSRLGQLGLVSGTALDQIMARRLDRKSVV